MATLETQSIDVGSIALLNVFLMSTTRTHDRVKLIIADPMNDGKSKSVPLPNSCITKVSCALVHWNSNLITERYAGATNVVTQCGLPVTADEYMSDSDIPMPSYKNPMPFSGPYDPMTSKPASKAVENSLRETMEKCGFYTGTATKDVEIGRLLPGAEIEEIPEYSTIKQSLDSAKGEQSTEATKIKLGFPMPQPNWVEADFRFDGQDGNQYDQLIKDDCEKIAEEKLTGYDKDGATMADSTRVRFNHWSPCQSYGNSWWPVLHYQLDQNHTSVRTVGPLLKEVEIYSCWYQIMCHEMWRGPELFWIEAWTVRGRRFQEEITGRVSPDQAARFLGGIQSVQRALLRANPHAGSRYQDAAANQHG